VTSPLGALAGARERVLSLLREVARGMPARSEHWNAAADLISAALDAIEDGLSRLPAALPQVAEKLQYCRGHLQRYERLQSGMTLMAEHTNALIDAVRCLDELADMLFRAVKVALANPGDWETARRYIDDLTVVFVDWGAPLSRDELLSLLDSRRFALAVLVDMQPYYAGGWDAMRDVLYRAVVTSYYCPDTNEVSDPCFQRHLGYQFPTAWDYPVTCDSHAAGCAHWSVHPHPKYGWPLCCYSYRKFGAGAVIELPFDGAWQSAEWLDAFVSAVCDCVLGVPLPRAVVWAARYVSEHPQWHACHPADACLKELAARRGWPVIDLRG
jgi:AcrR family transcriptional regulator